MKKMKNARSVLCLILVFVLSLALMSGCGASKNSNTAASAPSMGGAMDMSAPETAPGTPQEPELPEPDVNYGYYDKAESQTYAPPAANTKLIYTATIDLETTEFDSAAQSLEALVASMKGYFENSSLDNYGSYRSAYYTVRVPAENFESFCRQAGALCQLNNISRSSQDVSEYYYDTESRLLTQQTKLERLQELLSRAEAMEDIITLESAISETELEIERLTGTLRKYDSLVGYSTVSISLHEVYKLSGVEEPVIGFGAKLAQAFRSGCTSFTRSLQNFLLSLAGAWVGWLIFLVIAALAVILSVRVIRRRRNYTRPRAEDKKQDKE